MAASAFPAFADTFGPAAAVLVAACFVATAVVVAPALVAEALAADFTFTSGPTFAADGLAALAWPAEALADASAVVAGAAIARSVVVRPGLPTVLAAGASEDPALRSLTLAAADPFGLAAVPVGAAAALFLAAFACEAAADAVAAADATAAVAAPAESLPAALFPGALPCFAGVAPAVVLLVFVLTGPASPAGKAPSWPRWPSAVAAVASVPPVPSSAFTVLSAPGLFFTERTFVAVGLMDKGLEDTVSFPQQQSTDLKRSKIGLEAEVMRAAGSPGGQAKWDWGSVAAAKTSPGRSVVRSGRASRRTMKGTKSFS